MRYNKQGESAGCEQVIVDRPFKKESDNQNLLSSFSNIIEHIRVEEPMEEPVHSDPELARVEQAILEALVAEIFPFFASHRSLL